MSPFTRSGVTCLGPAWPIVARSGYWHDKTRYIVASSGYWHDKLRYIVAHVCCSPPVAGIGDRSKLFMGAVRTAPEATLAARRRAKGELHFQNEAANSCIVLQNFEKRLIGSKGYASGLKGYAIGLKGYAIGLMGYAIGLKGYAIGIKGNGNIPERERWGLLNTRLSRERQF
ncbi:hypothetical protein RRG08_064651 [Elysia crispata]|uniref:Uncharacterized protein n=1 Tax=Elysia crispata TaxID=231223 RepID=A0AAE1B9C1_9GAST|nr:hypothetical protein RRG08_064651 [Elysia crispata]